MERALRVEDLLSWALWGVKHTSVEEAEVDPEELRRKSLAEEEIRRRREKQDCHDVYQAKKTNGP
eukprot:6385577-Amphidinium_carterae.1